VRRDIERAFDPVVIVADIEGCDRLAIREDLHRAARLARETHDAAHRHTAAQLRYESVEAAPRTAAVDDDAAIRRAPLVRNLLTFARAEQLVVMGPFALEVGYVERVDELAPVASPRLLASFQRRPGSSRR
jgi:hypothetical protein